VTILIAISETDDEPWISRLGDLLPGRRIVRLSERFDRAEIEYAIAWRHPKGSLAGLSNLRAVFSLGAGVDHILSDPLVPAVPIVRVVDPDLTSRMCEWVVLHTLIHHRQQRMYDWMQGQQIWEDDPDQPAAREVRVSVMGLGVLGRAAATKLSVMGFDVAGWSRTKKDIPGIACFHGDDGLAPFLARTDILVALLPLTDETRGMLNGALFGALARDGRLGGPILLNAGRGGLQIEADIVEALDAGILKAATLDVFESEPLPTSSPIWTHPRITITPHNAALSSPDAVTRLIARQIIRSEQGRAFEHVVDRQLSY
jgi:glyoxylate/hydroxypyruvate reductase A